MDTCYRLARICCGAFFPGRDYRASLLFHPVPSHADESQKSCQPRICARDANSELPFQIQGLITLNNSSYNPQPWHGTLLVIGVVAFAIIFNTSVAKQLPKVEIGILVVHILGLFAIIIPLLVMAPSRNSGRVALLDFYNGGDWPTTGLATMIGLLTPLGSMLGFDCAVHMCRLSLRRLRSETVPLIGYS